MKAYHNIESAKSPFGDYRLGYAKCGIVFKITIETWGFRAEIASNVPANKGKPYKQFCEDTLRGISMCLEVKGGLEESDDLQDWHNECREAVTL